MAVDLEQRVAALVQERRDELVRLVDEALDQALSELVAERLALRNGNGRALHLAQPPAPAVKTCTGCARELTPDRFEKHRNRCRDCRRQDIAHTRERRDRVAAANGDDGPHP